MKTKVKVKTLNRDELAGRHGEGSSTTQGREGYTDSMPYGAEKVDDFFIGCYVKIICAHFVKIIIAH